MIAVKKSRGGSKVTVNGKKIDIRDEYPERVIAECSLNTLRGVSVESFPDGLQIEVNDENGFGTFLFNEALLSSLYDEGLRLFFTCNMSNQDWDGYRGLAMSLMPSVIRSVDPTFLRSNS
jgi:hypothetical protein